VRGISYWDIASQVEIQKKLTDEKRTPGGHAALNLYQLGKIGGLIAARKPPPTKCKTLEKSERGTMPYRCSAVLD